MGDSLLWHILDIVAVLIAIATLVFTIRAVVVAKSIRGKQVSREEYSYLISTVVAVFSLIEADIMLLKEGTYDKTFTKDYFDKEALLTISKAKTYTIMIRKKPLFKYLNSITTGDDKGKFAKFTEKYFERREQIVLPKEEMDKDTPFYRSEEIEKEGKKIGKAFLKKTRTFRDDAIKFIDLQLYPEKYKKRKKVEENKTPNKPLSQKKEIMD